MAFVDKLIENPYLILNYSNGIGKIIGIITFITLVVIISISIEWDGSKPGGWGYWTAGFSVPVISLVCGFFVYALFKSIIHVALMQKVGNVLKKDINKERDFREKIKGDEKFFF